MTDDLLIVFVKNPVIGQVKTRLSKTVGNKKALNVYNSLLTLTQNEVNKVTVDTRIYFSQSLENQNWKTKNVHIQNGKDLGERMKNAFTEGFASGYKKIVLIGSDLPAISANIITKGFKALKSSNVVFGPAEDGGYYLVGLTEMQDCIFTNKPWSQESLLSETIKELNSHNIYVDLIETLNDIDTFDDLKQYPKLLKLIEC